MKPLLKWAGGKAKLAPAIAEAFGGPSARLWIEPFLGAGSVYLHRRAAGQVLGDAILGDINPKLVAFHVAVRDSVDDLLQELSKLPYSDWRERYYQVREAFNAGPHEGPAHAARLLWLNRTGFNGLYRENRSGRYNVPCGSYKEVKLPSEAHLREVSQALEGAEIVAAGFEELMSRAGAGDQVYCDPPYVPLSQSADFTGYAKDGFDMGAQERLAKAAMAAAFRQATVVLSNHDLPVVRKRLYPENEGFSIHARPAVGRSISRSVRSRKAIHEVIARVGPMRCVA